MPSSRLPSSSSSASVAGTGSGAGSGRGAGAVAAAGQKSCATATMLEVVMMGMAGVREPRLVRERFEEDLCALVRATSVRFRHDLDDTNHPNVVSFELPGSPIEGRHRLEAVFDPARPVDDRSRQMLAAGAHVAGLHGRIRCTRGSATHAYASGNCESPTV